MILYFSATGNSKAVAQKLQHKFGGELVSIGDAVRRKRFEYELQHDEKVFFVMPVYFFGLPSVVKDFLKEFSVKGQKAETAAVFTYGSKAGAADRMFLKYMEGKNCEVKGVYGVKMPENCVIYFKAPEEEEKKALLEEADKNIDKIIENIEEGFKNVRYSGPLLQVFSKAAHPFYDKMRKTDKFIVRDNCIGCGLCQMVCPTGTIVMEDGKPYWDDDKCAWCLGCINRCPVAAIEFGDKTKDKGRYINPVFKR